MGHRRTIGKSAGHDDGGGHGGDRPWVFFMVDCFFLITEFFVLTFKFKAEESVLPQKLPPGGTVPSKTPMRETKEQLNIQVSREGGRAVYLFLQSSNSLSELQDKLARSAATGGEKYSVRVSYEGDVQWGDVMAVFNACSKVKIAECGLIPLRGGSAAPIRQ